MKPSPLMNSTRCFQQCKPKYTTLFYQPENNWIGQFALIIEKSLQATPPWNQVLFPHVNASTGLLSGCLNSGGSSFINLTSVAFIKN